MTSFFKLLFNVFQRIHTRDSFLRRKNFRPKNNCSGQKHLMFLENSNTGWITELKLMHSSYAHIRTYIHRAGEFFLHATHRWCWIWKTSRKKSTSTVGNCLRNLINKSMNESTIIELSIELPRQFSSVDVNFFRDVFQFQHQRWVACRKKLTALIIFVEIRMCVWANSWKSAMCVEFSTVLHSDINPWISKNMRSLRSVFM